MILEECHNIPIAGHIGRDKTLAAVASTLFWPHLRRVVSLYVQQCEICQQTKALNQKPAGLHLPLEIPTRRWEQVHMELITGLPVSRDGHDAQTARGVEGPQCLQCLPAEVILPVRVLTINLFSTEPGEPSSRKDP